jgi:hypothetical protein
MIKAIVKNGTIQPLEPLPADRSENRDLVVQEAPRNQDVSTAATQTRQSPRPNSFLILWIVMGAVVTLVVVGALFFEQFSTGPKVQTRAATTWHVRHEPQPGESATLKDALSKAQNGDRIVVSDQISEAVALTGVKDIAIEAEPGKRVQWFYPFRRQRNAAGSAVLIVSKSENVHIKGFDLDGRGFVDHVIFATGYCPGLTFEDLHLSGARRSGITFASCAGSGDNRVQCINLQVDTQTMEDAGLFFKLDTGLPEVRENENFVIRLCQFNGPEDAACRQEKGALKRVRYITNFIRTSSAAPLIQMPEAY